MNTVKIILIMIALSFCGLLFYGNLFVDDAYITLRYGLNLVSGYGLRFNPQDLNPLEGYTNFGWLLLQVPLLFCTTSAPIVFSMLSLLSSILTLYVLNRYLKVENWPISPAVLIILSLHSFWFWNIGGLETGFMGVLLLLWNIAFLRWTGYTGSTGDEADSVSRSVGLCVSLAFLSLITRPDAIIVLIAHIMFLLVSGKMKKCLIYGVSLISCLFPYLLFKYFYFGALLPNTFYAKTGFSMAVVRRGLGYILSLGGFPELWALFICFLLLSILVTKRARSGESSVPIIPALKLTCLMVCGYFLYFIRVGGDYFPYYRFLYPLVPWFVFVCSHLFLVLSKNRQMILILVFMVLFMVTTGLECFEYAMSFRTDNKLSVVAALCLKEHYPPGTVAVTAASGVVNYYCNFYSTDLYGLTDSRISRSKITSCGNSMAGHDKYDIELVRELKPELVIPHLWVWGKTCPVDFRTSSKWLKGRKKTSDGVRALLAAPFLKSGYLQRQFPLSVDGVNFVYIVYEKSELSEVK